MLDLLAVEVRRNKGRTESPQDYVEVRTRAFSTDASVAVGEKQMQSYGTKCCGKFMNSTEANYQGERERAEQHGREISQFVCLN